MIARLILVSLFFALVVVALIPVRQHLVEIAKWNDVPARLRIEERRLLDQAAELTKLKKNDERRLAADEELASLYCDALRQYDALKTYEGIIDNRPLDKKSYNEKAEKTVLALAATYRDAGSFPQAEKVYKRVLDYDRFYLSKDDPKIGRDLNNLGAIAYMSAMVTPDKLERELQLSRANSFLTQARLCYRTQPRSGSQSEANTLDNQYLVLREQGSEGEARQVKEAAADLHARVPGRLVAP